MWQMRAEIAETPQQAAPGIGEYLFCSSDHQLWNCTGSNTQSSSAVAESPCCRVGQFWPNVLGDVIGLSSTTLT